MKNGLIIFTIGLLLGLLLSTMWRTLSIDVPKPPVSKRSVVELKKEVFKSEVRYNTGFDSLKKESTKLEGELTKTKKSLHSAKEQNEVLKSQVYVLIQKQRQETIEPLENDSSCDSLLATVEHLMQSNTDKDSLYENAIVNLEGQVKNKDSTIALKDEQYQSLKLSFDNSLSNQELLLDENKLLGKQVKKQKFKSKILSAVLFIFSGAAINHLIKH